MIGTTVSHYRIIEKLGEGGMGVVYKAHDTKLDRTVALKFLPSHLASDPGDKARFVHEAKAASALDHPNICTIYEVDETSDGQMFIAMAHYEGTPLSKKIERGPLKLSESIDIATQVAEGLSAAHTKGIVHRDIKSSNIMITQDGHVKVLDFGLARKTGLSKLTRTGSTLGTAPYMSPEQARGEDVDHRTDLWSLGVVLYEMLTGSLPFRGEHEAAVLYSIVNEEPKPLEGSVKDVSPELIHLVRRMLEKDAGDRYQSAADLLIDLRRLKKDTSQVRTTTQSTSKRRSVLRRKWTVTAGLVLVAAVAVVMFLPRGPRLNPNMTQRLLDIPFSEIGYPGLSADGNWAAFSAADARGKWDIYLMNTSGGEPRRITTDSSSLIRNVDVSPDGSAFVYNVKRVGTSPEKIFVNSALGGVRRLLADAAFMPRYQPDGQRVFFIRGLWFAPNKSGKLEIWSIRPDGNDERLEFIDSISVNGRISLSVSPDGKSVVWLRTFPEGDYQEVFIRNLVTGKERQLTFDKKYIDEVCWTGNDQIIFSSDKNGTSNLWMVPAEGGMDVQITKGVGPDVAMMISSDGKKLLYFQNRDIGHVWISDLEGRNPKQVTSDDRNAFGPALSPHGNSIAFSLLTGDALGGVFVLYLINRDGSSRQQLTRSNLSARLPIWSADGKRLAFNLAQSVAGEFLKDIGKTFWI